MLYLWRCLKNEQGGKAMRRESGQLDLATLLLALLAALQLLGGGSCPIPGVTQ